MDIEKQVAELKAKRWDISCDTIYRVEDRSVDGEGWYRVGTFDTLDKVFDDLDQADSLRIVMRHTGEVVL